MSPTSIINLIKVSTKQEPRDLASKYYSKTKVFQNKRKRKLVRAIKKIRVSSYFFYFDFYLFFFYLFI